MEINEAANLIMEQADDDANIIFGAGIDPELKDEVRITVIATGFEKTPFPSREAKKKVRPQATPYGAAIPSYNPYENRTRVETPTPEQNAFDAPAPAAYDSEPVSYSAARPAAQQNAVPAYQPYAGNVPTAPAYTAPYQPYQPQYTAQAPQIEQPKVQPAANEKDDLGVPSYLRRERKK